MTPFFKRSLRLAPAYSRNAFNRCVRKGTALGWCLVGPRFVDSMGLPCVILECV